MSSLVSSELDESIEEFITVPEIDLTTEHTSKNPENIMVQSEHRQPNTHLEHVTHSFHRRLSRAKATLSVLDLLRKRNCPNTIVFANSKNQAMFLYHYLKTAHVTDLGVFTKHIPKDQWFEQLDHKIVICSEGASKGIDFFTMTNREFTRVVNLGLYEPASEYLQRAGRLGRAGNAKSDKKCEVITFVWEPQHFLAMQRWQSHTFCVFFSYTTYPFLTYHGLVKPRNETACKVVKSEAEGCTKDGTSRYFLGNFSDLGFWGIGERHQKNVPTFWY